MATGKVIKITRATVPGKDSGELEDISSGKKYSFEAPENIFKFGEEVLYDPAGPGVLKSGGMVSVRRTKTRVQHNVRQRR